MAIAITTAVAIAVGAARRDRFNARYECSKVALYFGKCRALAAFVLHVFTERLAECYE